jgi:hypothetical protein
MISLSKTLLALVTFGASIAATIGCGSSRDTVNVSGAVKYKDGSPITGGVRFIRFEPTDESTATVRKAASSEIATDGTFDLFTRKPGDGVFRGRYAVNFTVMTGATGGKSLIDPKYESPATTPYVVDVTEDMTDLVYELEPRK